VDDEPAVRALLVRALEEAGYVVVAVPDGRAAVEAQQRAGFDLVITNAFMPSLSGEELIRHLRQLFPALAILHLDDVKPFSLTALLEAVALAVPEQTLGQEA
jgi:CheY-like chemotaxis protein